jgi:hypothetical protein
MSSWLWSNGVLIERGGFTAGWPEVIVNQDSRIPKGLRSESGTEGGHLPHPISFSILFGRRGWLHHHFNSCRTRSWSVLTFYCSLHLLGCVAKLTHEAKTTYEKRGLTSSLAPLPTHIIHGHLLRYRIILWSVFWCFVRSRYNHHRP